MQIFEKLIEKNGLVFAFLVIAFVVFVSDWLAKNILKNKIPGSAIAILAGLVLAYFGGLITGGEKGISDIKLFKGIGFMGNSMFRDFAIVATAIGASWAVMKKAGMLGVVSLLVGVSFFFFVGVFVSYILGYRDAVSLCTN